MESQLWNEANWRGKYVGVMPLTKREVGCICAVQTSISIPHSLPSLSPSLLSLSPAVWCGYSCQRAGDFSVVSPDPSLLPRRDWPVSVQSRRDEEGNPLSNCPHHSTGLYQHRYVHDKSYKCKGYDNLPGDRVCSL